MTHSSVMPMDWAGRRSYLYCGSLGVVAVSAQDGSVLWTNLLWRISIATVPSPLVLPEGRVFLTGGYDAGSLMLQVKAADGRLSVEPLFRLPPTVFGAIQHTPIYFDGHIYGVRSDGQFACLTVDGKIRWTSGANNQFGLGAFLMAGGLIYALHDSGRLSLFEATPSRFNLLAQAQVLQGREAWGPMALVGGQLLLRDYTRLVCLEVGAPQRALQAQVP
jgi:outer membrane protein assembly factor BamB